MSTERRANPCSPMLLADLARGKRAGREFFSGEEFLRWRIDDEYGHHAGSDGGHLSKTLCSAVPPRRARHATASRYRSTHVAIDGQPPKDACVTIGGGSLPFDLRRLGTAVTRSPTEGGIGMIDCDTVQAQRGGHHRQERRPSRWSACDGLSLAGEARLSGGRQRGRPHERAFVISMVHLA